MRVKIGVFYPHNLPFSARTYIDNIMSELNRLSVDCTVIRENAVEAGLVDIYWDPRAMGGAAPYREFARVPQPVVVTVHGAASWAVPMRENYESIRAAILGEIRKRKELFRWRIFRGRCAALIAVSSYGRQELTTFLGLGQERIIPIWHGVNREVFRPGGATECVERYFLHISQFQKKKNVRRIFRAYASLTMPNKPRFVAVVPGYDRRSRVPAGVELMREPKSPSELSELYRGALAFVFPSIHETFGIPIIEAMASGCPVITSKDSACPEIAGDAALLVDPRSVEEIRGAMERMVLDADLRNRLRNDGVIRSECFSWPKSARQHLAVFEAACTGTRC